MRTLTRAGLAIFAVALFSFIGFSAAQVAKADPIDPCTVRVSGGANGFNVTNLSGTTVTEPTIELEFSSGNASYVEVSNSLDFSQSTIFPVGYPYDNREDWDLSPGYGLKNVYVRYLNSCQLMPSIILSVAVNYVLEPCAESVYPPVGGFSVSSWSGYNVTNQTIQLAFNGGDNSYVGASFAEVSNNSDFSESVILPYTATTMWTLSPGYGLKTVYVRYLNSCQALPSPTVSATVNYVASLCDVPVTPPAGGFSVNNLSGVDPQSPIITLQFAAFGSASYAQVSNTADFSSDTAIYPVGYPYDGKIQWSLSPGYGLKDVYVRYLNSCQVLPSPTVIVELTYWPSYCSDAVTGTLGITSTNGSTVTTQTIPMYLASGSARYAHVSNYANFSSYTTFDVGYPFDNNVNWTLTSGYGSKTVYVKYFNECQAMPSATKSVTVNYANACSIGVTPPAGGFKVTSLSGSTVRNPNVTLGMFGGNASYMQVSNYSNFYNSTYYPYASTLNWTLSPGYGYKTVYVRYWNSCKTKSSSTVSVRINYTR